MNESWTNAEIADYISHHGDSFTRREVEALFEKLKMESVGKANAQRSAKRAEDMLRDLQLLLCTLIRRAGGSVTITSREIVEAPINMELCYSDDLLAGTITYTVKHD